MNAEKQLESLTQLGTQAVQSTITEYTHWYLISSSCWCVVGLLCAIAALCIWKKRREIEDVTMVLLLGSLTALSVFIIAAQLPTVFSPRAYAIHQLIKDVTK